MVRRRQSGRAAAGLLGAATLSASPARAADDRAFAHDISPHAAGFQVHRWHQPGLGSVNSWAIETDRALIVIDGQRSLSAGRALAGHIRALGKPVAAVVLTHPHPDHIGGLPEVAALRAPGAPLLGLAETRDILREDRQGYLARSRAQAGYDFPASPTLPDRLVEADATLGIAGLTLRFRAYREVEAPVMLTVEVAGADAVFGADMVENGMTAFLLENRPDGWLRGLATMAGETAAHATLYPGHGVPGAAGVLIGAQRAYLERSMREAARGESEAVAAMRTAYPGYLPVAAIPDLLERNVRVLRGGAP